MLENATHFLATTFTDQHRLKELNFDTTSQVIQRLESTTPILTLELMFKDSYIVK